MEGSAAKVLITHTEGPGLSQPTLKAGLQALKDRDKRITGAHCTVSLVKLVGSMSGRDPVSKTKWMAPKEGFWPPHECTHVSSSP